MHLAAKMTRYCMAALILAAAASSVPLQNITLPLPAGTTNHATPGLLCTPTKWNDVITFYLFNYVAHAATVLTRPGERSVDYFISVVGSLLYPTLGMFRGIEAILSGAIFAKDDELRKAARSGALCMVVRGKNWRPVNNDKIRNVVFRREKEVTKQVYCSTDGELKMMRSWTLDATSRELPIHVVTYTPPWLKSRFGTPAYIYRRIIHGRYMLPEGYQFAIVPSNTEFITPSKTESIVEVSATHNVVKSLIAIVQAGYAFSTLYRARGDQIEQFGFAAFGLTVTPYAVMSIINLVGNLCRPDYASLYMVENSIMDEARARGGFFEGAVARAQEQNATVCACQVSDAEEAEELSFTVDNNQSITATFNVVPRHTTLITTSQPERRCFSDSSLTAYSPTITDSQPNQSPQCNPSTSTISPRTHPIKPLPPKQAHNGTENDGLLLIPCCNPLTRHISSDPTDTTSSPPSHQHITSITLRKANPPFPRRYWALAFAPSPDTPPHASRWQVLKYTLTMLIGFTPLFIIAGLSRMRSGTVPLRESQVWLSFMMQWLIIGVTSGICWVLDQELKDASPSASVQIGPAVRGLLYFLASAPALGGFISVAQMLVRYGVCVWVGD